MNIGPDVGRVPTVGATFFCDANDPANASTKMMGRKRPNSMAIPSEDWNQSLVTVKPPNALPLLFDADAKAYSTSLKPWMDPANPDLRRFLDIPRSTRESL